MIASTERMTSSAAAYRKRPPGPARFIAIPPTRGPTAVPTPLISRRPRAVPISRPAERPSFATAIDDAGNGMIEGQRLYQLVRQKGAVRERTFAIEFLDPGAQAFAFTFG